MKFPIQKILAFTILSTTIGYSALISASESPMHKDVQSLNAIIDAYYRVISGPKGFKYDPETDQFLHAPNAIITRFIPKAALQRHTLPDEQKSLEDPYPSGFYEIEIHRKVESYGNIANVWSTYEVRGSPDSKVIARGVNNISLYFDSDRWWIASWSTQQEGDEKIPKKYLQ